MRYGGVFRHEGDRRSSYASLSAVSSLRHNVADANSVLFQTQSVASGECSIHSYRNVDSDTLEYRHRLGPLYHADILFCRQIAEPSSPRSKEE